MAEIEFSVLRRQCLCRRIPDQQTHARGSGMALQPKKSATCHCPLAVLPMQGSNSRNYILQQKLDTALVEAYEEKHCPIPPPDPIEAILHYMESQGLSEPDLETYLGSDTCVSEVLNRERTLSLDMIRKLHKGLGIPADILVQPYACRLMKLPTEIKTYSTYPRSRNLPSKISVSSSVDSCVSRC